MVPSSVGMWVSVWSSGQCNILEKALHWKSENLSWVSALLYTRVLTLLKSWASGSSSVNGDNNACPSWWVGFADQMSLTPVKVPQTSLNATYILSGDGPIKRGFRPVYRYSLHHWSCSPRKLGSARDFIGKRKGKSLQNANHCVWQFFVISKGIQEEFSSWSSFPASFAFKTSSHLENYRVGVAKNVKPPRSAFLDGPVARCCWVLLHTPRSWLYPREWGGRS